MAIKTELHIWCHTETDFSWTFQVHHGGEEEIFALKQKEYDEHMTLVQHPFGEGLGVLSKCKT